MSKEEDLIKIIANTFPKSIMQMNHLFECDSEVLKFGEKKLLLNVDEFSAEDMLRDHDPYALGWNIAIGSISDILAAGGTPLFYAHNLVIYNQWDEAYISSFSKGIADVLKEGNVSFVGGDFGISKEWRYTGVVIGQGEKTLFRSGAMEGDAIYISGKVGAGNLEAVLKLYDEDKRLGKIIKKIKNRFFLRFEEGKIIRKYANACIDTSDGLINGLNQIAKMSDKGYMVQDILYLNAAALASKLISLPKTLLSLGECGEYELLFTLGKEKEKDFLREAKEKNLVFYKIGEITNEPIKVLLEEKVKINLENINIRGRDYENTKEYISDLVKKLKENTIRY